MAHPARRGIVSDRIRKIGMGSTLIETARTAAGMTKDELASLAGTSRPTLSAYEHGRKSPRLDTAERIIGEAGFVLAVEPKMTFHDIRTRHRRVASIPNRLPRLPAGQALATVELPLHLDWSSPGRCVDLRDKGSEHDVTKSSSVKAGPTTSSASSTAPCSSISGATSCSPQRSGPRGSR